ncbi:MAG: aspartyl protease family protein [Anaerolineae bacterium]|nr:aspartyl protease family protein [Anaerolineae bacterium]
MRNSVSIVLLVVAYSAAVFLLLSAGRLTDAQSEETPELNRGQLQAMVAEAEAAFEADPENIDRRVALATLHYQAGHFETARDLVAPVFESSLEATNLMVNLEYLFGHYDRAEELVRQVMANNPLDFEARIIGQIVLSKIYYHTNRFAQAQEALDLIEQVRAMGGKLELPGLEELLTWMHSFGEPPYQIDWGGKTETVLPFVMTDPLPVIQVEVNGTPIYAIIDTGGAAFILDTELAASLGVETAASLMGTYGGGLQGETGFAEIDSLTLGDVTISSVPTMTLPVAEMTATPDFPYTIQGILTTSILEQFLGTIDYPSSRLILRPKTGAALAALQQQNAGKTVAEVPFYLAETHYMMVKGTLNGDDDLTFFVDSGLVDEGAMSAPIQTLEYLGIPVPETVFSTDNRGGGGAYASGNFPIAVLGLGSLRQEGVLGEYGSMAPETYWEKGFIQDGLVSHRFLRRYAWTIDFTNRMMIFAVPE